MHFKFSYISNKISDGVDYFLLPGITCRSYIAYIHTAHRSRYLRQTPLSNPMTPRTLDHGRQFVLHVTLLATCQDG